MWTLVPEFSLKSAVVGMCALLFLSHPQDEDDPSTRLPLCSVERWLLNFSYLRYMRWPRNGRQPGSSTQTSRHKEEVHRSQTYLDLKWNSVKIVLSEIKPAVFSGEELLTAQNFIRSLCNVWSDLWATGCSLPVWARSFLDISASLLGREELLFMYLLLQLSSETLTAQSDLLRSWYTIDWNTIILIYLLRIGKQSILPES